MVMLVSRRAGSRRVRHSGLRREHYRWVTPTRDGVVKSNGAQAGVKSYTAADATKVQARFTAPHEGPHEAIAAGTIPSGSQKSRHDDEEHPSDSILDDTRSGRGGFPLRPVGRWCQPQPRNFFADNERSRRTGVAKGWTSDDKMLVGRTFLQPTQRYRVAELLQLPVNKASPAVAPPERRADGRTTSTGRARTRSQLRASILAVCARPTAQGQDTVGRRSPGA